MSFSSLFLVGEGRIWLEKILATTIFKLCRATISEKPTPPNRPKSNFQTNNFLKMKQFCLLCLSVLLLLSCKKSFDLPTIKIGECSSPTTTITVSVIDQATKKPIPFRKGYTLSSKFLLFDDVGTTNEFETDSLGVFRISQPCDTNVLSLYYLKVLSDSNYLSDQRFEIKKGKANTGTIEMSKPIPIQLKLENQSGKTYPDCRFGVRLFADLSAETSWYQSDFYTFSQNFVDVAAGFQKEISAFGMAGKPVVVEFSANSANIRRDTLQVPKTGELKYTFKF